MCLLCVTETDQYPGSVLTHVIISLTLRDGIRISVVIIGIFVIDINTGDCVRTTVCSFAYLHLCQQLQYISGATEKINCRFFRTKEGSTCIQGIGIKKREHLAGKPLQLAVVSCIGHRVNREQNVESWTCRLTIFLFHVVAAIMDRKAHIREKKRHI